MQPQHRPQRATSTLTLFLFGTMIWAVLFNLMTFILYLVLAARTYLPAKWQNFGPGRPTPLYAASGPPAGSPGGPPSYRYSPTTAAKQRALLQSPPPPHRYPAYVIALDPAAFDPAPLARLEAVRNLTLIRASNGTDRVMGLPLYTRHVLRHGRSEHHQLGNTAAVGCLFSHADAWARVAQSGEPSIVFEEDTVVAPDSDFKLTQFLASMEPFPWDLVMLDTGHLNSGGPWSAAGPLAANCSEPGACERFGTRA